jgi:hypothetical protein
VFCFLADTIKGEKRKTSQTFTQLYKGFLKIGGTERQMHIFYGNIVISKTFHIMAW